VIRWILSDNATKSSVTVQAADAHKYFRLVVQ